MWYLTSPSIQTPSQRDALIVALIENDLRAGRASERALGAWRELEWRRCKADPEYFIEHYGYLITKAGDVERWKLWPKQRLLIRDLNAGKSIVAIKARQLGVTTLLINFRLWKVMFHDAARCHFVSDSEEKGKEAMTKMAATYDRLPSWMKERATSKAKQSESRRKDRKEGSLGISFGLSELKVLTSTPNSVAGVSGDIDLDEFGRHREQKRVLDNAIPAFQGGGQMVVIGNGNGEDELFHLYQKAARGEFPGMSAYFFSWRDDPTRDDEWYADTKRMYLRENPERDIYSFKAQYPETEEEAFYVTGNSFFDLRMVNGLSKLARKSPRLCELRNAGEEGMIERFAFHKHSSGRVRVYEEPKPGARYVCGVDPTGDGRNGDYAVLTMAEILQGDAVQQRADEYGYSNPPILDGEPAFKFESTDYALDVVAVFQSRTEPVLFSHEVERICRHYNDAFAVIERNNSGGTVVSHIKESYWNLYTQVKVEKFADDRNDIIGYWETEASKKRMLDNLNWWLSNGWLFVHDSPTVSELGRFGYNERGQLRAPKGLHDDLVFGLGLCVVGAMDLQLVKTDGPEVNFGIEW